MTEYLAGWHRRGPWVMAAVALAALAGCGTSSKTTNTTSTAEAPSPTTVTTAAGGGSSTALGSLAQEIQQGAHTVYKAVYTYNGSGTSQMMVTIEQDPPKSAFKVGAGEVIATGSATYYCATSSTPTCFSAGTQNPLANLVQALSPSSVLGAIQQAESEAVAHTQGYSASFSNQSFAGQASDCVTLTAANQTGKYCVTKSGILAYSGTSTTSFQLTSYSSTVSASDFTLPSGATVQTLPAGITIPSVP